MKYIIQKPVNDTVVTIEFTADELDQFDSGIRGELDERVKNSLRSVSIATSAGVGVVPATIEEFVNPVYDAIKKNSVRMAAIAYYLKQSENREAATRDDLLERMQRVGWPIPKNFTRDIQTGMGGRSPMFTEPSKGQYRLTPFGEKEVEKHLQVSNKNEHKE